MSQVSSEGDQWDPQQSARIGRLLKGKEYMRKQVQNVDKLIQEIRLLKVRYFHQHGESELGSEEAVFSSALLGESAAQRQQQAALMQLQSEHAGLTGQQLAQLPVVDPLALGRDPLQRLGLEDLGLPEQDSASEEEDEDEAPAPCLLRQDSASHGNQQSWGSFVEEAATPSSSSSGAPHLAPHSLSQQQHLGLLQFLQ